jgi:hypothetical protein
MTRTRQASEAGRARLGALLLGAIVWSLSASVSAQGVESSAVESPAATLGPAAPGRFAPGYSLEVGGQGVVGGGGSGGVTLRAGLRVARHVELLAIFDWLGSGSFPTPPGWT